MQPVSFLVGRSTILLAFLLAAGPVRADEAKSAAPVPKPTIHRLEIYNGSVREVNYFVQGGSPHLEALARLVGYTENQVTLAEHLQRLKLELVNSERRLTAARTAYELGQLGQGPLVGVPGLFGAFGFAGGAIFGNSLLGLEEANYAAAVQMIRDLEQLQKEMAEELKKGPPGRPAPQSRGQALPLDGVAARPRANVLPPPKVGTSPTGFAAVAKRLAARPAVPASIGSRFVTPPRMSAPVWVASDLSLRALSVRQPQPQPLDQEREKLDKARDILDEERVVLDQERVTFNRLSKDPAQRAAASERWQAACQRWAVECQRWSEACKEWSDVCAQRAAAKRDARAALSQSGSYSLLTRRELTQGRDEAPGSH
jgi:hypothetical protein